MNFFFKKLEYCVLIDTTKIENAIFPYQSALSDVKTNITESTN